MLKKIYNSYGIIILLIIGVTLRFLIFFLSPPTNSYDDHLEVINSYSIDKERPLPFSCWECYQPPVYYSISAVILKSTQFIGLSKEISWKFVQLLNPLLSILMLFLVLKILSLFKISKSLKILYLSFVIVLPRDIFTSVMIGNDYLLVFLSIISLYFYFKYILLGNKVYDYICLSFFVVLGGLTKQHGLLLMILPGVLIIKNLKNLTKSIKIVSIFILIFILLILEEVWKFNYTGVFMVSNQNYFDFAINQFPGKLADVEFFSFRILKLFEEPFISNLTAASLPTEIFARIFFDYEYRFFSPKINLVNTFGRIGYSLGLIWSLFFIVTFGLKSKLSKIKFENFFILYIPLILGVLFLLVPVVQTIRYPYFSSMKAMFLLPGLIILFITHAIYIKDLPTNSIILSTLSLLNIIYGITLMVVINLFIEISLDHLHGPLWPIP